MTDDERRCAVGLLQVGRGTEHVLRRELRFTKSKRRRLALAEELVAVMADVRRLEEVLHG